MGYEFTDDDTEIPFFFFSSCSLIENRRTRNLIFDSKVCKGILHKIIYKINIEIIFKKKKKN